VQFWLRFFWHSGAFWHFSRDLRFRLLVVGALFEFEAEPAMACESKVSELFELRFNSRTCLRARTQHTFYCDVYSGHSYCGLFWHRIEFHLVALVLRAEGLLVQVHVPVSCRKCSFVFLYVLLCVRYALIKLTTCFIWPRLLTCPFVFIYMRFHVLCTDTLTSRCNF